ncbi:MAG: carboxynorspermidine decarboxylase [Cyclobacteriaceae bacterium]|jgi:carboxynorspermidine decarboxylase|nr:carboxynorspermidine decarboxylase [Cyclobacteriaceae bacterium]
MNIEKIPSPCFMLDEFRLKKNLEILKRIQTEADVEIILALKGFAMWSTFPLINKYLKGATASSLNEAELCSEFMNKKAHTYAVAYEMSEFDRISDLSTHITFNSLFQYEQFKNIVSTKDISCALRVNPEFSDVKTELYNPSSSSSRLGITKANFPDKLPDGIDGLHFHVLCESDSYALEGVLNVLENKFGYLLHTLKWINMGGGHAFTRVDYNVEHLIEMLKKFKLKYDLDIILEPGSAVAWQTGELYTTILDIVENGGTKTAIIDASFTCHMPDCLEMPYRPSIEGGYINAQDGSFKYRIGGVSCLAGDFLEEYSFDRRLSVGDAVIFKDMMHYTMVKTSTFNGIKHPSLAIKNLEGDIQVVKEFGYADYRDRLS